MRPVAALLLGGLISCCGSGGTASAQAAGTSQAVESPADSVRRDDASMQPAHALDSPSLLFAAGVFALVEAYDYPYSFGVTFVARPLTTWRLSPGAGFAVGPDGIAFMYVDVRRDFALGERWYFTPSLATGWFINGDVIGPRDHLEFQSGIHVRAALRQRAAARAGGPAHFERRVGASEQRHGSRAARPCRCHCRNRK